MRCQRPAIVLSSLLGLLMVCSGCFGPYPSQYGGYGNPYGGGYPAPGGPVQTLQPGGTYTPSPYGQPASPYGVMPQDSLGQPTMIDQTGGNAPFYGSGNTTQPYDGGGVPTYSDPNEINFQQPVQPDNTAIDTYGAVEGVSAEVAAVAKVDLEAGTFMTPIKDAATPDLFEPTEAKTVVTDVPVSSAPYAHDAEYKWIRGVLRFDAGSGVWTMTYSENPSADDEHGGKLLVADTPNLESYKPQAVVTLKGEVDAQQSTSAGRAVYRADTIEQLELTGP